MLFPGRAIVTSKGRGSFVEELLFYSFWGFVFQTGKVELFYEKG